MHWGPVRPDEISVVARLPATSVVRTLADLVLVSGRDTAVAILDAALHDGSITDLAKVRHTLAGRQGVAQSLPWLALVDGRAESPLETRIRLTLTDAGLAPEELQWPVMVQGHVVARLDLAWPSKLVCVEADGTAVHAEPHALYRDRHRQNMLIAAGWTVFRFTWADDAYPDDMIQAVAAALDRDMHHPRIA
jgi:hypothetical protein